MEIYGSGGWGFEYCSARGWSTSSVDSGFIIEVRDRLVLVARINPQVCRSFDDATRLAEQALADAGIDDWTVVVSQSATDQQPCPSLAFDSASRRILLVPIDRVGS